MISFALNFLACLLATWLVFGVFEYRRNRAVRQLGDEIKRLRRDLERAEDEARIQRARTMWDDED